jgi:hypothetical protein
MKSFTLTTRIFIALALFLGLAACQKEYSIETNANLTAQGTLKDTTTGDCMPETITGTFYGGIEPGRDTAYVSVNVMVTNPGTYTIYTDTQDGFNFSDSGYFATTGLNVIKLKPVGTPILPGTYDFNVTFDTSICTFTLIVQDSTGTGLGTFNPNLDDHAWQFDGPSGNYHGQIGAATEGDTVIQTIAAHYLYLFCPNSAGDSALQIVVGFPGNAITTGTFSSALNWGFSFQDGVAQEVIYQTALNDADATTTLTITSYDATTHIVSGSFSGQARDKDSNIVSINNGAFTAKIQ